jgi:hypothetical protein
MDCMTNLDAPATGLSEVHPPVGEVLVLHLEGARDFKKRCPDLFRDLVECAGFVNWRRIDRGHGAVLALSFYA